MKKFFARTLLAFYISFVFIASGMASELYYIKNANKASMLMNIQNAFKSSGYTLKKEDPIYGVKGYTNAVVILQQTNSDLYYFYDSADDTSLNKTILKKFKNSGSTYKKVTDAALLSSFNKTSTLLKKSIENANKKYSFSDEEYSSTHTYKNNLVTSTSSSDVLTGHIAKIPVGTTFDVYLQTSLNTANAAKGDEVTAILTKNWEYNGIVVAQQGSVITGVVTKASAAGMAYRNGYLQIKFYKLTNQDGKTYDITTEQVEFKVDSTGKAKSAATKALAGAAVGAVVGLLIGAMSDSSSYGKSIAISSGAGAVVGLGTAALEQGMDAEIPTYTEMVLKLTSPLNIVVSSN